MADDVKIPELQSNRALQPRFTQYMDGDRRIMVLEVEWPLEGKRIVPLDFYFLKKVAAEILGWEAAQDFQVDPDAEDPLTEQDRALIYLKKAASELLHHEADEEAAKDNEKEHGSIQAPKVDLSL